MNIPGKKIPPQDRRPPSALWLSIIAVGIRLGTGAASYLLYAVVARACGPAEFGVFGVLLSAAMMIGTAGSFGQQVFILKEVAQATATNQTERAAGAIVFSTLVVAAGSVLSALAFVTLVPVFFDIDVLPILLAGAALSLLFAISQATMGMLRAESRVLFAMVSRDLVWRVLSLAAVGVSAVAVGIGQLDAFSALLAVTFALLPVVTAHIVLIFPKVSSAFRKFDVRIAWRQWFGTSAGLAIAGVAAGADLYAYTIVLGTILPATETGVFFAGLKTVELLNLFLMAVTLVVTPELARLVALGDPVRLQKQCNSAVVLQGAPAIFGSVVMILAAPVFLWFFDPSFIVWSDLLRLLAIGMLINALAGATGLMMQLAGMHWLQATLQGGSLLLALAALPMLVAAFGLYGAAMAFVLSKLIWNALAVVAIRRKLHIDPSILGLFDHRTGGWSGLKADLALQLKLPRG